MKVLVILLMSQSLFLNNLTFNKRPGLLYETKEDSLTLLELGDPKIFTRDEASLEPLIKEGIYMGFYPGIMGFQTNFNDIGENHLFLDVWLSFKMGKYLEARTHNIFFHNFKKPPYSLPFYDPFIYPDYRLHAFERQPVIGQKELFDIRTDMSSLRLNLPFGFVETGKNRIRWGPGYRGTLFISGYARPLTFIYHAVLKKGRFKLSAFNAMVPDSYPGRRFSAQRVEMALSKGIVVGINEGVLYSEGKGSDPMKYFAPLAFYYVNQRRGTTNWDNLIASFDFSWTIKKGFRIYGEFFDDDFIITSVKMGGPSLYAYMAGLHAVNQNGLSLRLEYTWVRRWTYIHLSKANSQLFWGFPIGWWAGPDSRDTYLEFKKSFENHTFSTFFEFFEHGEGNNFLSSDDDPDADPYIKTPSGIVDRRLRLGTLINLHFKNFDLGVSGGMSFIKNYKNQQGNNFERYWLAFFAYYRPKSFFLKF